MDGWKYYDRNLVFSLFVYVLQKTNKQTNKQTNMIHLYKHEGKTEDIAVNL